MYLTTARFREMGFGVDVTEINDRELSALIAQASSVVDAYCNVPRIPQKHDFRGGSITGEQHSWKMPEHSLDYGQRRMYPFHWPILQINQFRIYVTNSQYVEIAPSELFINNSERWFEIVSYAVTSIGMFGAMIVPNIGLATPVAKVDYDYGWDFTVTDEPLTHSDGQTWRAQNQYWHSTADVEGNSRAPVIKKNGSTISTGFTIDYDEGTIVLDDNRLVMIMTDAGGMGVSGLMQSLGIYAGLRVALESQEETVDLGTALAMVNRTLCGRSVRQLVGCAVVLIDLTAGRLSYANAGLKPPLLLVGAQRLVTLEKTTPMLGADPDSNFEPAYADLSSRFRVIMHTNGLTDALSPAGESYGEERLHEVLLQPESFAAPDRTIDAIIQDLEEHLAQAPPGDDILILVVAHD